MADETTSPSGTAEIAINKQTGGSAGKVMSSNGGEKELPRYLRASTGSCHDLCKYGRKHASEEKPWRLKIKKTVKKIPDEKNEALCSGASPEMKKALVVKKKQVVDSKTCSHDDPEIIKREVAKSKSKSKSKSSGEQRDSLQEKKKRTTSSKPRSLTVPESQTSGNPDTRKQKVLLKSHSGRATLRSKETKPSHDHVASPNLKLTRGPNGGKEKDLKTDNKVGVSKVLAKKVLVSPRASFSPKASPRKAANSGLRKSQSLKVASSPPNQKPVAKQCEDEPKQSDDYPVQEKTLHVIKMEDGNNKQHLAEPSPPPSSSSTQKDEDQEEYDEYSVSEAEEYECDEAETTEEEEDMMFDRDRKLRQRNVMDVEAEGGGPRKLKFRRGRVLGEDASRNRDGRRRFKTRADNGDAEDDDTGEKVVLRHQDVQDKKDAQGLFNNVIEETASKLVETRKSKVKALVGAFETVISLQETKPAESPAT